jgi:hypothetical protein
MSGAKGGIASSWTRQFHRLVSIASTVTVIANFVLADLLAAGPAGRASVSGPVSIRGALYREVARRARGMKISRTGEAVSSGLIRTGTQLPAVYRCGLIAVGQ